MGYSQQMLPRQMSKNELQKMNKLDLQAKKGKKEPRVEKGDSSHHYF